MVTTNSCPVGVVAGTLRESSKTVITGGLVSALAGALAATAQMDAADRQTVYNEHLQADSATFEPTPCCFILDTQQDHGSKAVLGMAGCCVVAKE